MIEKSEYFSDVMKKHFNKEPVITKEDNEDFKNSTKCWIFHNDYIDDEVKIRDKKKNYDSHLIMQELGKFNPEISTIPNGLEKCMSFTTNNKLSFINIFQSLISSLDSLIKNLNKYKFRYLSQ